MPPRTRSRALTAYSERALRVRRAGRVRTLHALQKQQVGKLIDQIAHDELVALVFWLGEAARQAIRMLGLQATVKGCVFDLDEGC